MDDDSARLRLATRAIFEECYPADDIARSETFGFPHWRAAVVAAERVIEVRAVNLPERHHFSASDIAFEIRYALGQAPASIYVEARSKDRGKRDRAMERLVGLIAERFSRVEMSRTIEPGQRNNPFAHIQVGLQRSASLAPAEQE